MLSRKDPYAAYQFSYRRRHLPYKNDVNTTVHAIINSVEAKPAPLRLAPDGDAYHKVKAALVARLEALDAQKELALASEKNN